MDCCRGDSDTFGGTCGLLPDNKAAHGESVDLGAGGGSGVGASSAVSDSSRPTHLWEAALVVKNSQYPMRLCGNEVDAGLVVQERDVLPGDLLPVVLLLYTTITILMWFQLLIISRGVCHFSCTFLRLCARVEFSATHLLFPEYDPVEEELQVLICVINAKLFKAVECQILVYTKHNTTPRAHTHTLRNTHLGIFVIS